MTALDSATTLVTGGSGLLGGAFKRRLPGALYPASAELDVRDPASMDRWLEGRTISTVVHAAAFTSPPKIDQDPLRALETNVWAPRIWLGWRLRARLAGSSTFRPTTCSRETGGSTPKTTRSYPVNRYAWSKLGGECAVRLVPDHLIIRTSFGPDVFPYPKAFHGPVDLAPTRERYGPLRCWRSSPPAHQGTVHLGGPRRTVLEYATSLDPDRVIEPLARADVPFDTPADTSLDTTRYQTLMSRTGRIDTMKVLVAGGAGYIGSRLVPALRERGY